VLPNGDALLIIYTSYNEYEPEVSLMSARLRFGAEEWDMPSPMFDTPGANDHAPLLLARRQQALAFLGQPLRRGTFSVSIRHLEKTSARRGARSLTPTSPARSARASSARNPINTVVRDAKGSTYVAV